MGAIIYLEAYKLIQISIKNAHFLKTKVPTQVHKNGHNLACDQYFFHETCTIGFGTHRAINSCQKLKFYEISGVIPFLITGHIYSKHYPLYLDNLIT